MSLALSAAMRAMGVIRGELPMFTSVGCYPLVYVVTNVDPRSRVVCAAWCGKCCNAEEDDSLVVSNSGANWGNPSLYCEACEDRIESAYAEDEVTS